MFYFDILERLYHSNIQYLIVGGLSVNLHGVPRVMQDIDLIISTDAKNVEKLCNCLKELGYVPRLPKNPLDVAEENMRKEWIEKHNLRAFSFYPQKDNYKVIDIVLDSPLDFKKHLSKKPAQSKSASLHNTSPERTCRVKIRRWRMKTVATR